MNHPTIGRIVHYHRNAITSYNAITTNRDDRYRTWYPGPMRVPVYTLITYAAMITGVDPDTSTGSPFVDLCVYLNEATPKGRAATEHASEVPFSETPQSGFWSWPPR